MEQFAYPGNELDLFSKAIRWKNYYSAILKPYVAGDVLEVGAGIGGTARFLCSERSRSWTCLEPDPRLASELQKNLTAAPLPIPAFVRQHTVRNLSPDEMFDTVLYIDVLEHIEDDSAELRESSRHLRSGGHLIVLAPAHHWLYSPFDKSIGHWRRYNKADLLAVGPPGLRVRQAAYLDSAGLLASAANRFLLRSSIPSATQIAFWDSYLVRLSRLLDPVTRYRLGKTVVAVWAKV